MGMGWKPLRLVPPSQQPGMTRGVPRSRNWSFLYPATGENPRPLANFAEKTDTVRDEKLAALEAVLFLASEPLSCRKLARLAHLADATQARTLLRQLNAIYDKRETAFRAEEVTGGFQLLTRPQFGGWIRHLLPTGGETRLTHPALETLAVVAYRQPVLRAEVEAIRGVKCGEILRQLMEKDLVRILGRSEELGRPYLYGTTRQFLRMHGLRDLEDLPRPELRRGASAIARVTADDMEHSGLKSPTDLDPNEEREVRRVVVADLAHDESLERKKFNELASHARAAKRGDEAEEEDFEEEEDDEVEEEDSDEGEEEEDDEEFDDDWEEVEEDEDWEDEEEEWEEDEDDDSEEDDDWDEDEDEEWEDEGD